MRVRKFAQHFLERKFVLESDHRPLLALFGENNGIQTIGSGRIQR